MCGIVGVAGNLTLKQDKAFRTLLIMDSLRGIDSTGIAAVSRTHDVAVAKQVGDPYVLMETKPFEKAMAQSNVAIIGHNRWATTGNIIRKNAHPFEFDGLVGVHNGTLQNKYRLDDSTKFDVDSENLFYHMERHGVDKTIPMLQGAWSLVWWDKEEETLNFLRNKERPMFMAFSKDKKVLLWASENWMLNIAGYRAEFEIEAPIETPVDTLLSFKIARNGDILANDEREVKGAAPFVQAANTVVGGAHKTYWEQQAEKTKSTHGTVIGFPGATSKKEEVTNAPQGYVGSKQRTLEVLAGGVDDHGGRYLTCYDEDEPTASIRLYVTQRDNVATLIGTQIIADIGKLYKGKHNLYFKVDYSSVRKAQPDVKYLGPEGPMPKEEWENKYGMCCWCGCNNFPADKISFINKNQALCEDCSKDDEVKQYI